MRFVRSPGQIEGNNRIMEIENELPPASPDDDADEGDSRIVARWGEALGASFTAIPTYFLQAYHRLGHRPGTEPNPGTKGLSSTEALVVIHLMSYRWGTGAPFPSLKTIADRMGITQRAVRKALQHLGELGYIRREYSKGGLTRYHFNGLIRVLEELKALDAKEGKRRRKAA